VSLASITRPSDERPVIVEGVFPQRYPSILFGDGGTAKSMLAASLLLDVSRGAEQWLGHEIKQHGPVVYLDFELDLEEQARRVYQLAEGVGLDAPPKGFYYLSGEDDPPGAVLEDTLALAKAAEAKLVLLDSLGYALDGDAEASKDVLKFIRAYIKPFEKARIAVLIVDHQSKVAPGESYHQKTPFGSVYKSNSCRSVVQVGLEDQRDGETTVRFRHKKANFGGKFDAFEAKLTFDRSSVMITHRALSASEVADEGTLNTAQKMRRLLEKLGPLYPEDFVEKIRVSPSTVSNNLTKLRNAGEIEDTGITNETGAHQVKLSDSSREGKKTPPEPRDPRQTTVEEFLEHEDGTSEGVL
jgi:DNA-binding transcriptional ArsR family regulator